MALLIIDGYYFEKMQKNWGLIDYDKFEAFLEERIQVHNTTVKQWDHHHQAPPHHQLTAFHYS